LIGFVALMDTSWARTSDPLISGLTGCAVIGLRRILSLVLGAAIFIIDLFIIISDINYLYFLQK
jgi:hypothetical protein